MNLRHRLDGSGLSSAIVWARWLLLKARKRAAVEICRRLYRDTNHDIRRSMIVAGAARSGTTWLADIIRSQVSCRVVWEPFSPGHVPAFSQFTELLYRRPFDVDQDLEGYVRRVLQGDSRDPWIDRNVDRIRPTYRLVKSVRAGLFLKWMHNVFPEIPLLYVVRHPCAIVLSRMEANWDPDPDLDAFFAQPALIEDHLVDKLALMKAAQTIEEKHAIIWCILHLIPSKQFRQGKLPVVFYENLCLWPEKTIPVVFGALGQGYQDSVFEQVHKPSRTTSRKSAILTGQDKVVGWTQKLSAKQVRKVLAVVRAFGLEYLYGDSTIPLVAAI